MSENDTTHSREQPSTSGSHNQSLCDESIVHSFSYEEDRSYCSSASFDSRDDLFLADDVEMSQNGDELPPVDVQIEWYFNFSHFEEYFALTSYTLQLFYDC